MLEHIIPTLFSGAILIVHNGQPILKNSYGMANIEHNIPNTTTTKFRIASLSKAFTAACILLLEQQGKLTTNDTLDLFFPTYPNGKNITIHHLLTHLSGIFSFTTD